MQTPCCLLQARPGGLLLRWVRLSQDEADARAVADLEEAAGAEPADQQQRVAVEPGMLDPAVHVHRQSLEQRVRISTVDNYQGA